MLREVRDACRIAVEIVTVNVPLVLEDAEGSIQHIDKCKV